GAQFRSDSWFLNTANLLTVTEPLHYLWPHSNTRFLLCSYAAIAKCADATATTNILFSGTTASLLFRMQAAEYVLLTVAEEDALMASLHGHLFIVEVFPVEPGDNNRAWFFATNIWDPVAAFY
ncbi:hypothetical protein LINGRAHAP2_LOCUS29124, partial [Linum grandiflorum]